MIRTYSSEISNRILDKLIRNRVNVHKLFHQELFHSRTIVGRTGSVNGSKESEQNVFRKVNNRSGFIAHGVRVTVKYSTVELPVVMAHDKARPDQSIGSDVNDLVPASRDPSEV